MGAVKGLWRPVPFSVWSNPDFRRADIRAQVLYLFAMASRHSRAPGFADRGAAELFAELFGSGVSKKRLASLLDPLTDAGLLVLGQSGVVVPDGIGITKPNPNQAKGWTRELASHPDQELVGLWQSINDGGSLPERLGERLGETTLLHKSQRKRERKESEKESESEGRWGGVEPPRLRGEDVAHASDCLNPSEREILEQAQARFEMQRKKP